MLSKQQHLARARAYERAYDLIDEASELITNEAIFTDEECAINAVLLRAAKSFTFDSADKHTQQAADAEEA